MSTVTTPVRISPLGARQDPPRDRHLDVGLVPGDVVEHPAHPLVTLEGCRALLVERDAANADGVRRHPGTHEWFILEHPDPEMVGTMASFATHVGARFAYRSPKTLQMVRDLIEIYGPDLRVDSLEVA